MDTPQERTTRVSQSCPSRSFAFVFLAVTVLPAGSGELGYRLREWALNVKHPCLTPRIRQVLAAICLVANDEHREFWTGGKRLVAEHMPDMSYSAYRNCAATLVRNGLLVQISQGGGRTVDGRGKASRYLVNSSVVRNPHPAQDVKPDTTRSPEACPRQPVVDVKQTPVDASAVHQRIDEMLATGITNEQMLMILKASEESLISSSNKVTVVVIHG